MGDKDIKEKKKERSGRVKGGVSVWRGGKCVKKIEKTGGEGGEGRGKR